jgi:flagellar FliL protein
MEQEIGEDGAEDAEEKKKGKSGLFMMLAIPVIAALAFFLVTKVINPRFAPTAAAQTADDQQSSSEDNEKEGFMCELGTVLANPADQQTRRIMKVGVSLEVTSEKLIKEIERSKIKLQHQLIVTLTSTALSRISTIEGKTELQEELRQTFESQLQAEPGDIRQVYFTEFIIQ